MHLAQLEEEDADKGEDLESNDPGGIEGVMEEFMVQLDRVVKNARDKKQLNGKEGMVMMKGAWPLQQQ